MFASRVASRKAASDILVKRSPDDRSLQARCDECAPASRVGLDFSKVPISPPVCETCQSAAELEVALPTAGGDSEVIDEPPTNPSTGGASGPSVGPAAPAVSICDAPIGMTAVVSGAFQGGLSMDDYYPDLKGRGFWDHGGTAGPFDTGTWVGSNAQLIGEIRIPCDPAAFSLAQTVTYTKTVRDGVHHPNEGKTMDDIAKSGRDATKAPFRQEFMGSAGWAISMADPPAVTYGPSSNIEWDRSFVTSLVAPSGRKDVSWSTSIRVVNGSVTKNTITT
jgi:hypothetical protein